MVAVTLLAKATTMTMMMMVATPSFPLVADLGTESRLWIRAMALDTIKMLPDY